MEFFNSVFPLVTSSFIQSIFCHVQCLEFPVDTEEQRSGGRAGTWSMRNESILGIYLVLSIKIRELGGRDSGK